MIFLFATCVGWVSNFSISQVGFQFCLDISDSNTSIYDMDANTWNKTIYTPVEKSNPQGWAFLETKEKDCKGYTWNMQVNKLRTISLGS